MSTEAYTYPIPIIYRNIPGYNDLYARYDDYTQGIVVTPWVQWFYPGYNVYTPSVTIIPKYDDYILRITSIPSL